jgi:hypothetical protein
LSKDILAYSSELDKNKDRRDKLRIQLEGIKKHLHVVVDI